MAIKMIKVQKSEICLLLFHPKTDMIEIQVRIKKDGNAAVKTAGKKQISKEGNGARYDIDGLLSVGA